MSPTSCLDEATIVRLADDQVPAGERARLWAHVDSCEQCQARMQQAIAELDEDDEMHTAGPLFPGSTEAAAVAPGTAFGRYFILEPLGLGGLGEVYSAYDPELDRKVALKLLRVQGGDARALDLLRFRLVREARALARLNHPNAVVVYDVGTAHDRVFIAMELVEGRTLREWVEQEDPDWAEVLQVLTGAGRAVAAAHAAGLIHRDFKPRNVMVTEEGEPKVLDFGLALGIRTRREAQEALNEIAWTPVVSEGVGSLDEPLTAAGELMGTPGYMAPEQYDQTAPLDERLDQFAFCVTLHEACYRQRPFRGKTIEEIRDATLAGEIAPPPPGRSVPPWLRSAILRGLSLSPASRFASMNELLAALEPPAATSRSRWIWAAGLIALLGIASGATYAALRDPAAEQAGEIGELTRAARAAAAKAFFVYPPPDDPEQDTAYSVITRLEELRGELDEPGDAAATELRDEFAGTLIRLGDRYWEEEGGRPFAVDYYAMALVFDPEHEKARERSLLTVGGLASLRQRAEERSFTEAELEAAAPLAALAEPDESQRIAKIKRVYASSENKLGVTTAQKIEKLIGEPLGDRRSVGVSKIEAPSDEVEPPIEIDEEPEQPAAEPDGPPSVSAPTAKPLAKRDPDAAAKKTTQGKSAFAANRLGEAERLFNKALEYDSRHLGALSGLAELHFERGQYRRSLGFAKRAVRRAPRSGKLQVLLGDAHFKVLEYAAARRAYERAEKLGHPEAPGRLKRLQKTTGQ